MECDFPITWEVEDGPFNDEYVEVRLGTNSAPPQQGQLDTIGNMTPAPGLPVYLHERCYRFLLGREYC